MRQTTIFPPYVQCRHCARLTTWPRWIRTEHLHYECLCWPCYERIDDTFTSDMAICQALIIVGIHQGKRRPLTIGGAT